MCTTFRVTGHLLDYRFGEARMYEPVTSLKLRSHSLRALASRCSLVIASPRSEKLIPQLIFQLIYQSPSSVRSSIPISLS